MYEKIEKIRELLETLENFDDEVGEIEKAIELRFKRSETPIELDEAHSMLEEQTSTIQEILQLIEEMKNEIDSLQGDVEDLMLDWKKHLQDNPDADELPSPPPINDPSRYDQDLFGNKS